MKENGEYKFTCSSCGGHELIVTHAWNVLAGPDSERWQEWGPLKENHHWQYKFKEKVEEDEENEHNEDKEDAKRMKIGKSRGATSVILRTMIPILNLKNMKNSRVKRTRKAMNIL